MKINWADPWTEPPRSWVWSGTLRHVSVEMAALLWGVSVRRARWWLRMGRWRRRADATGWRLLRKVGRG